MAGKNIAEQLASLESEVHAADNARRLAQDAADRAGSALAAGATNVPEIVTLRDLELAKLFRRPGVDTSTEALLAAKKALLRRIEADDDLVLVWLRGEELRVTNTAPARALDAARAALEEATARLEAFLSENREELLRLQDEARRAAFKEDIDSGDPERVKEALGLGPTRALTTQRLAQPG